MTHKARIKVSPDMRGLCMDIKEQLEDALENLNALLDDTEVDEDIDVGERARDLLTIKGMVHEADDNLHELIVEVIMVDSGCIDEEA